MAKLLTQGTHRDATSSKGWREAAPKLEDHDRALVARCGRGAFLKIWKIAAPRSTIKSRAGDPAPFEYGYPIVAAKNGCQPDCRGLLAAKSRAAALGHSDVVAKAQRIAQRAGCKWARK